MMRKLSCSIILLLICFGVINNTRDLSYTTPVRENLFLATTISFFDSRDKNNLPQPTQLLFTLFVENIYETFVKDELQSFKAITKILSKPFFQLWFVRDIVNFNLSKINYFISEVKKNFSTKIRILFCISLPFVLLFYIKTHLRTYRFAPMVLRC
ncbi:MAG: hypothetical protein N2Z73_00360 [Endomicrobia bacterium]|nr:hypothetical protein [Endomicrobiia bacterium]